MTTNTNSAQERTASIDLAQLQKFQRYSETETRLREDEDGDYVLLSDVQDIARRSLTSGAPAEPAPNAEQARARLSHALSVFNEHMPPGGLSSIGYASVGKALLAILSEPMLSAGPAAKTEQADTKGAALDERQFAQVRAELKQLEHCMESCEPEDQAAFYNVRAFVIATLHGAYAAPAPSRDAGQEEASTQTVPDDSKHIESEAVSTMLWLYRRLHRCYGRPPNVERPIVALAKLAGFEMNFIAESFAERNTTKDAP